MMIVLRPDAATGQIDQIREHLESRGLRTSVIRGTERSVIACIGEARTVELSGLTRLPAVEAVRAISTPYKLASRVVSDPTTVVVGGDEGTKIGTEALAVIAGPCSVEGEGMLRETARAVQEAGAGMLRGGAFKPRTSPYAFTGLGREGLELLGAARAETGMPVVTEVMDPRDVELVAEFADVLQIGARNMQNYPLLAEVGRIQRPVLLKRGLSATISELLLAAEHVMARGNRDVILCERGIRTFEPLTRNTLDLAAVPVLKRETHLPVIVDPSHAAGRADLVAPLSFAAIAAGADGLIVEVHPRPERARSDGDQALTPAEFAALMDGVRAFASAAGRTVVPRNGLTEVAA